MALPRPSSAYHCSSSSPAGLRPHCWEILVYFASDLSSLLWFGERLHARSPSFRGSLRQFLAQALLRVRDKRGVLTPLKLNRAQLDFEQTHQRRSVVLKARQLGITTWIAARFFLNTITRPGTVSVQVAHNQDAAEEIFRIVHRFLENLPERLRLGALVTSRANIRQLVFPRLDSEYRVESAADVNAGRGLTIRNLHCSEVARWPGDPRATLASLRAAVAPDGEIVLESTPNGAGGCFYDEWQRAGELGYTRHFFPWWYAPEYALGRLSSVVGRPETNVVLADDQRPMTNDLLTADERALQKLHGLSDAQLAFRRELRANFGALAPQEYAEDADSCFLASGECVFDIAVVEKRLAELCGADVPSAGAAEVRDNGRLLIFWPSRANADYIIGADPAGGGTDGDFACAQVIERITGLHCAELHGHFPPQEFAARLTALGREYNHAVIAVERNNHGHAVLAHLTRAEQYDNIYVQRGQAGWLTTVASRPALIERFAAMLRHAPQMFSSARLLRECRSFIRQADGISAAAAGAHDDCVFAMGIALAVREELAGAAHRGVEVSSVAI